MRKIVLVICMILTFSMFYGCAKQQDNTDYGKVTFNEKEMKVTDFIDNMMAKTDKNSEIQLMEENKKSYNGDINILVNDIYTLSDGEYILYGHIKKTKVEITFEDKEGTNGIYNKLLKYDKNSIIHIKGDLYPHFLNAKDDSSYADYRTGEKFKIYIKNPKVIE